jgi:hypothetical protein
MVWMGGRCSPAKESPMRGRGKIPAASDLLLPEALPPRKMIRITSSNSPGAAAARSDEGRGEEEWGFAPPSAGFSRKCSKERRVWGGDQQRHGTARTPSWRWRWRWLVASWTWPRVAFWHLTEGQERSRKRLRGRLIGPRRRALVLPATARRLESAATEAAAAAT